MKIPTLDPDRFTEMIFRCQRQLFTFLCRLMHQDETAREIAQEACEKAWKARQERKPPFDGQHEEHEMRRWLFRVAYNEAISYWRRNRKINWRSLDEWLQFGDVPDDHTAFEDAVAERQSMHDALQALDPEEVACLILFVVHELRAAEVGQIIGLAAPAAAKRFARAKVRLREIYMRQNAQVLERK